MMTGKSMMALVAGLTLTTQAAVNNYWYPVDGTSDGAFDDISHWKINASTPCDHLPGAYDAAATYKGDNAFFQTSDQDASVTHYTVSYPKGDFTNYAGLSFQLSREAGITLDGTGTHLVSPRPSDDGKIANNGFKVQMGSPTLISIFHYDFNGNAITTNLLDFNDFLLTVTNAPGEHRLEFVRGTFSFPSGAYKMIAGAAAGSTVMDTLQVDKEADVYYGYGSVCFGTASITNRVLVDGGKLEFGSSLQLPITAWAAFAFGTDPRLIEIAAVDGGELTCRSSIGFGSTKSVGTTNITVRLLADNAHLAVLGATSSNGAGNHEIVLRNGATGFFNNKIKLGNYGSAAGLVSFTDSSIAIGSGGGEWVLGGATAVDVANGAWGELTVARSTLSLTNSIAVTSGKVTLSEADIVLWAADKQIYSRDQHGAQSTLEMDGVRFALHPNSTTAPFGGFASATVGAKGLSIESDNDITIEQPLANAAGVKALLTLNGAGTKTFSGDMALAKVDVLAGGADFTAACMAEVVSTNGALVSFGGQTTASQPLAGLTLGSATTIGYLQVSPGEKIYVADGAKVSLSNLYLIVVGGALSAGQTVSLVCGGTVPDALKEAWTRALVEATFDAGYTWGISEKAVAGGGTELVVEAIPDDPLVITVASGKDVHETNILYSAGLTLKTEVAKDAELELDGKIGFGRLVQTSGGRTRVTGSSNELLAGIEIDGGALEVASPASLGTRADSRLDFKGGAFIVSGTGEIPGVATLNTATKETPMVFKTDGDVTLALSTLTQGKIAKLGSGTLTFLMPDGNNLYTNMGWGYSTWTSYDEANGTLLPVANNNCGTFDVSAGKLVLKNTGATVPVLTVQNGDVMVKGRDAEATEPTVFELDHVNLTTTYNAHQNQGALYFGTANAANVLSLKNQAVYRAWFYSAYGRCLTYIDNALLKTDSTCYYTSVSYTTDLTSTSYWHVVNGGRVEVAAIQTRLPSVSVYDGSVLAKNAAGEPIVLALYEQANVCQEMTFRNQSLLSASYFGVNGTDQTVTRPDSQRFILTFDDAEWFSGTGERVIASSNVWVDITTTGGGLRLNPPADATWTLYTPVSGEAGITKGGDGTLVVDRAFRKHQYLADPVTLAYEGRTTVTGGTLKVTNGADAHFAYGIGGGATLDLDDAEIVGADLAVVGDGTLVNAKLTGMTLRPAYGNGVFAQLTIGSGTTLDGKTTVDFGRTAEDPLPTDIKDAVIAHWTGTKPDVSMWRSAHLGNDEYRMKFVANDDGTITGTCSFREGLMLIFR